MMLNLRRRTRSSWLAAAMAACCMAPAQGQEPKTKAEAIAYLPISEENRIAFLDVLKGPVPNSKCVLTQIFWDGIDIPPGKPLSLGLFRIDRRAKDAKTLAKVDVLSLLVSQDSIWLRLSPSREEDTEWIELNKNARLEPDERDLLFRGCRADEPVVTPEFLDEPCQGRADCRSRLFFTPKSAVVAGKKKYELIPERTILERTPLGTQGVAGWHLQQRERLSEISPKDTGLTASHQIWKVQAWRADQPERPISENIFFPQIPSAGDDPKGTIERLGGVFEIPQLPRPARAAATTPCGTRILAPRTHAKNGDWGLTWSWKGLSNAHALDLSLYTDNEGCLKTPQAFYSDIFLENENLSIQRIQKPTLPVFVGLSHEGPNAFVAPGGDLFEILVAANAFTSANQGLEGFRLIYDWIPTQVKDVKIYQVLAPESRCSALRVPGSIYLPSACPGVDGYVAKGLCSDVVVHELAHEVTGSLAGLATAGQTQYVLDGHLDEALADFFAVLLRLGESDPYFAPGCQNDSFEIEPGNGSFNIRNFSAALLDACRDDELTNVVAKLASLATLYGYTSKRSFQDAFFDFAKKSDLGPDVLAPICESFSRNAGICDERCPPTVGCLNVDRVEARQGVLKVSGTFNGTPDCPSFTITTDSGEEIFTPILEPQGPWQKPGDLGSFTLPPGVTPPFNAVFQPKCSKLATGSRQVLSVPAYQPDEFLKTPAGLEPAVEPAEVIVAGPTEASRQLVVRFTNGQLWSYQQSDGEAASLGQKLWPGFSVTPSGTLQGWTTGGRTVALWFSPEKDRWERKPSEGPKPETGVTPGSISSRLGKLLQENPRVEVLKVDAFEIALRAWPERGTPEIYRRSFEREIDPASLEIGLTRHGPALAVKGRYPDATYTYVWREGGLRSTRDLVVFPLETPALSFREDGKEVRFEILKPSVCRAPPYVLYARDRLLALTCDGVLASYPVDAKGLPIDQKDEQGNPVKPQPAKLEGILVPGVGARPIQLQDLNGDGTPELVLGPFRRVADGATEDRVEILDITGKPFTMPRLIRSSEKIRGAPAVIDLDRDGCAEVVTATDRLGVWKPKCGLPGGP